MCNLRHLNITDQASCACGQAAPVILSIDGPNNTPDIIPYVQHNKYNRKITKIKLVNLHPFPFIRLKYLVEATKNASYTQTRSSEHKEWLKTINK